jgi:hypothetical protein
MPRCPIRDIAPLARIPWKLGIIIVLGEVDVEDKGNLNRQEGRTE